jgi:hypothetical protein
MGNTRWLGHTKYNSKVSTTASSTNQFGRSKLNLKFIFLLELPHMKRSSRRTTLPLRAFTTNLASKGLHHNPICPLCRTQPETPQHLLTGCSFTREVLRMIWSWFSFAGSPPHSPHVDEVAAWLAHNMAATNGQDRRNVAGILLYFWWNVWKERNMHVFENV